MGNLYHELRYQYHYKLLFYATLLFLLPLALQAQQQVVYKTEVRESFVVTYVKDNPSFRVPNHLIRELSRSAHKSPERTEFTVTFTRFERLTRINPFEYSIWVELRNLRVSGDVDFRGFNMTDCLLPSGVDADIQVAGKEHKFLHRWQVESIPLVDGNYTLLKERFLDSTGLKQATIQTPGKKFIYNSINQEAFDQKAAAIVDYYNAVDRLNAVMLQAQAIDPNDYDNLYPNKTLLIDLQKQVDGLGHPAFVKALQLTKQDPVGFLPLRNTVHAYVMEKKDLVNATMIRLPEIFYSFGMDCLAKGDVMCARNEFKRSLQANGKYGPSLLQLAILELDVNPDKAKSDLIFLLTRIDLDPATRDQAGLVVRDIYTQDVNTAHQMIKAGNIEDAHLLLMDAAAFCNELPEVPCSQYMYDGLGIVLNKMFMAKVDEADQHLNNGHLEMAEQMLNEAINFKNRNPAVQDPDNLLAQLKVAIYTEYYKQHVDEGLKMQEQGQHARALDEYTKAQKVQQKYDLSPDNDLWMHQQASAKPLILENLDRAQAKVRNNQVGQARSFLTRAEGLQEDYGLMQDDQVREALFMVKDKLMAQECRNAEDVYRQHCLTAKRHIEKGEFVAADQAYDQAITEIKNNANCELSDQVAQDGKNEILHAARYQELKQQSTQYAINGRNDLAVQTYLEAGEYYFKNEVSKFNLQHDNLFEYLNQSIYHDMVAYGATHLIREKRPDLALKLLKKLLASSYPKSVLKPTMEQAGRMFAAIDAKNNPDANPKVLVLDYTEGDKQLNKLKKAYLKQWKMIK